MILWVFLIIFNQIQKLIRIEINFIKFYDRSPDLRCYAQHLTQKARKFKHPIYLKIYFFSLSLLQSIKFITSTLSYNLSIASHTSWYNQSTFSVYGTSNYRNASIIYPSACKRKQCFFLLSIPKLRQQSHHGRWLILRYAQLRRILL